MFLSYSYCCFSKFRCNGDVLIAALVGHEDMPATIFSTTP
jgi:hypothetical protein